MNYAVILALIASLQKEVTLLEAELVQQQAVVATTTASTAVPTSTPLLGVYIAPAPITPTTTLSWNGMAYPYTTTNAALINQINTESANCTAMDTWLQEQSPLSLNRYFLPLHANSVSNIDGVMLPSNIISELESEGAGVPAGIANAQTFCDAQVTTLIDGLYKGN